MLLTVSIVLADAFHELCTTQIIHKYLEANLESEQCAAQCWINKDKSQGTQRRSKDGKPIKVKYKKQVLVDAYRITPVATGPVLVARLLLNVVNKVDEVFNKCLWFGHAWAMMQVQQMALFGLAQQLREMLLRAIVDVEESMVIVSRRVAFWIVVFEYIVYQ